MIDDIEEFSSELHVKALGQAIVLENREIEVDETRSIEWISAAVPEQSIDGSATGRRSLLGRHGKTLQLNVVIRISSIHWRSTAGSSKPIRISERVGIVQAQRITPDENCERRPRTGCKHSSNLPPIERPTAKTGQGTRTRNLPRAADHEILPEIKVGLASPESRVEEEGETRWRV